MTGRCRLPTFAFVLSLSVPAQADDLARILGAMEPHRVFAAAFGSGTDDRWLSPAFQWPEAPESDWTEEGWQVEGDPPAVMVAEVVAVVDQQVSITHIYRRIKIRRNSGRHFAELAVPFGSTAGSILAMEARTVYPSGEIITVDPRLIRTAMFFRDRGRDEEINLRQISMPGITGNCLVESLFTLKTEHHDPVWEFQQEIPLLSGAYVWTIGPVWTLVSALLGGSLVANHLWIEKPPLSGVDVTGSFGKVATFKVFNVPAHEIEPLSLASTGGRLITYYGPGGSPREFWTEAGEGLRDMVNAWVEESERAKDAAKRFRDVESDRALREVLDWVGRTYPVESEKPTLDSELFTLLTEEKLDDALDSPKVSPNVHNALCYAILKRLRHDVHLGFTRDRRNGAFLREAKLLWQLDRMVLGVPGEDGRLVLCSPGESPVDPLLLPWFYESGSVLDVGYEIHLVLAPARTATENAQRLRIEAELARDGTLSADLDWTAHGHSAAGMGETLRSWGGATAEGARTVIEERFPLARVDSAEAHTRDGEVVITARLRGRTELGELASAFRPYTALGIVKDVAPLGERTEIIAFPYPFVDTLEIALRVPDGFSVEGLNNPIYADNQAGLFTGSFSADDNTLVGRGVLRIDGAFLPAEAHRDVDQLFGSRMRYARAPVLVRPP